MSTPYFCWLVQVDMLEGQLGGLRAQQREARAAAAAHSEQLEAEGRRIALEAQRLLDLGSDVRMVYHHCCYLALTLQLLSVQHVLPDGFV